MGDRTEPSKADLANQVDLLARENVSLQREKRAWEDATDRMRTSLNEEIEGLRSMLRQKDGTIEQLGNQLNVWMEKAKKADAMIDRLNEVCDDKDHEIARLTIQFEELKGSVSRPAYAQPIPIGWQDKERQEGWRRIAEGYRALVEQLERDAHDEISRLDL